MAGCYGITGRNAILTSCGQDVMYKSNLFNFPNSMLHLFAANYLPYTYNSYTMKFIVSIKVRLIIALKLKPCLQFTNFIQKYGLIAHHGLNKQKRKDYNCSLGRFVN